jgi:hypothetical protein
MARQVVAWADAHRTATGEKLAFMQTDIVWSEPAMRNLKPLAGSRRRSGSVRTSPSTFPATDSTALTSLIPYYFEQANSGGH